MGGDAGQLEIEAYLHQALRLPRLDRQLLDQAASELIADRPWVQPGEPTRKPVVPLVAGVVWVLLEVVVPLVTPFSPSITKVLSSARGGPGGRQPRTSWVQL